MITFAEEFIRLRKSEVPEEQSKASYDFAEPNVWRKVIIVHPEYKTWVIHNKTIQVEILEELSLDSDHNVRSDGARQRKINKSIFDRLKIDESEEVRHALLYNSKLSAEQKRQVLIIDNSSQWFKEEYKSILENKR